MSDFLLSCEDFMRYKIHAATVQGTPVRSIHIETSPDEFTTFPAEVGNPVYDAFLDSQGLTDAEVQAMEPDVWHDLSAI